MRNTPLDPVILSQIIDGAVEQFPDSLALVYWNRGLRFTWRELGLRVDRLAKGLINLGIQKNEKAAIWAPNVPYWVELLYAAAKVGAVLLPINTQYSASELRFVLSQSKTENLFLSNFRKDPSSLDIVSALIPDLASRKNGEWCSADFPLLKRICLLEGNGLAGAYSIAEILEGAENISDEKLRRRCLEISPDDMVNMQYTSGTTGFPKGVMLSHTNIVNNGYSVGENQRLSQTDRVCVPVPLYHCFGCVMGVIGAGTHASAMVVLERPDPGHIAAAVKSMECTALYGVPAMFISILNHPDFHRFRFDSLRTGIMAGSPCPADVMRQVVDSMHMNEITICYGMTETSPVITQTRPEDSFIRRITSAGRPLPGVEVRIIDPCTGTPLSTGMEGEVCCRGYNVMLGYHDMPEETSKVLDEEGWLHSGDCGMLDEDGYLHITGRLKDLVIRGGENISPREIEEFLRSVDSIVDVQVVGVPSRRFGEEVCAFIIMKEGSMKDARMIRRFCRGKISRFKIPRHVFFVDKFPMTGSGKVQKFRLREWAAAFLKRDVNHTPPAELNPHSMMTA